MFAEELFFHCLIKALLSWFQDKIELMQEMQKYYSNWNWKLTCLGNWTWIFDDAFSLSCPQHFQVPARFQDHFTWPTFYALRRTVSWGHWPATHLNTRFGSSELTGHFHSLCSPCTWPQQSPMQALDFTTQLGKSGNLPDSTRFNFGHDGYTLPCNTIAASLAEVPARSSKTPKLPQTSTVVRWVSDHLGEHSQGSFSFWIHLKVRSKLGQWKLTKSNEVKRNSRRRFFRFKLWVNKSISMSKRLETLSTNRTFYLLILGSQEFLEFHSVQLKEKTLRYWNLLGGLKPCKKYESSGKLSFPTGKGK